MAHKDFTQKAIMLMIAFVIAVVAYAAYSALRPTHQIQNCSQYAAGDTDGADCAAQN